MDSRIGENGPNQAPASIAGTWDFSTAGDYTYDTNYISVTAGRATLLTVDQTFNSASDFALGSHTGTLWDGSGLTLGSAAGCNGTSSNCAFLDSSWTPRYANIEGYWRFDNTTVNEITSTTGSLAGNTAFTTTRKIGSHSLEFDGANDYFDAGEEVYPVTTGDVSVCAWVKSDVLNAQHFIVRGNGTTGGFYFSIQGQSAGDPLRFTLAGVVDINSAATNLNVDEWYHLCVTYDHSFVRFYVNGRFLSSTAETRNFLVSAANTFIGAYTSTLYSTDGVIDEVAIWSQSLTDAEISQIYERQFAKFAGAYNSPIINIGTSGSWTSLDWVTSVPFGKELPGSSGNEVTTSYSSLVNSSGVNANSELGLNLQGLWKFNNNEDDSSTNTQTLTRNNATYSSTNNLFNNYHAVFDGSGDTFEHGTVLDIVPAALSLAVWFKVTDSTGGSQAVFTKVNNTAEDRIYLFARDDGTITFDHEEDNNGYLSLAAATNWTLGKWYFVVITWDTLLGKRIFVNGQLSNSDPVSTTLFLDGTDGPFLVGGSTSAGLTNPFQGNIDELAYWSRSLNANEILEMYRRGSNRVKFQVRSCNDAACSGEAWEGADGTIASFFGEGHNCTSINGATGFCNGATNTAAPTLTFADFVSAPIANQYFQYQAILESDDEIGLCAGSIPCLPSVSSIEIGPTGRYYGGSPAIRNNTPVSFTDLNSFTVVEGGTCGITYQISNDNVTYYYWNGANWVSAGTPANSNSAAVVNTNINQFVTDVATGNLYWRAYLNSNLTQSCELDNLEFDFD